MARTAFIIGRGGQIGRAAAGRLLRDGWHVTIGKRGALPAGLGSVGCSGVRLDRDEPGALSRALGDGADLLIDCIAYDEQHADQLLAVQREVGCIVAISSASVYRDAKGRTLDEARVGGFPDMPLPITEERPTIAPGPETYSTRKAAMEVRLRERATTPVTILRPCAIYGKHSSAPREWFFIKRMLDGRARVALAYEGQSRFHTVSVENIAALIAACAERPAHGILNAVDPHAPSVVEIVAAIEAAIGRSIEIVALRDPVYPPVAGVSPWTIPRPFMLSDAAARAVGYEPVGEYAALVAPVARWLASIDPDDWRRRFTGLDAYPFNLFDYAREDHAIARAAQKNRGGPDGPPRSSGNGRARGIKPDRSGSRGRPPTTSC